MSTRPIRREIWNDFPTGASVTLDEMVAVGAATCANAPVHRPRTETSPSRRP